MSPPRKASRLIKRKLKAVYPCVPLVFFPLYTKAGSHASVVCLALSVLDNHPTGALPLWDVTQRCRCPALSQRTGEGRAVCIRAGTLRLTRRASGVFKSFAGSPMFPVTHAFTLSLPLTLSITVHLKSHFSFNISNICLHKFSFICVLFITGLLFS